MKIKAIAPWAGAKRLSDEGWKNLKKRWEAAPGGLDNAHRIALLEEGVEWQSIGISAKDSQFLETRRFQVSDVARIFQVPLHMLADLERATFCLPRDAEVYTESGPKSIADVSTGEMVWSRDEQGFMKKARVLRSACTGTDTIYSIRTTNRAVRANGRHRVLVRRKHPSPRPGVGGYQCVTWRTEYIPVSDLGVGDTLVTLKNLPAEGSVVAPNGRELTEGFMEFCGLLLGDGNINKGRGVTIARADGAVYMGHYRDVMRREFISFDGGNGRKREGVATKTVVLCELARQTRFSSVLAAEELELLGFNGTARTKSVPGWVFGVDSEMRLALLRGFLDADGHVDKKGRLSFRSCSESMLSQVRHLCIGEGVPVTNLRCQEGVTTLPNGKRAAFHQFEFTCSDPAANMRIGSHDPRYIERLGSGSAFKRKDRNYPHHGGQGFNDPDCGLARIVSIEIEPKEEVYDLEVEGAHSFIANGVVVHNSNIEAQGIDFVTYTLTRWLKKWESEVNRKLIPENQRRTFFSELTVEGLLRGDSKTRSAFYSQQFRNGFMTINEVRTLENLNFIEGDGGHTHFVNAALVPVDQAVKEPEPEPVEPEPVEDDDPDADEDDSRAIAAHKHNFEELWGRILLKERNAIQKAATKANFETITREFYSKHEGHIYDVLIRSALACVASICTNVTEDAVKDLIRNIASEYCKVAMPSSAGAIPKSGVHSYRLGLAAETITKLMELDNGQE